jgi:hypothetical protein
MGMAGSFATGAVFSGRNAQNQAMNTPKTTRAAKLQSLREWEVMTRRYPLASPWGLLVQGITVLTGNLTIAWLVATGRMSPLELVLLVAIEAVLLIGIAMVHSRFVPKESLEKSKMGWRERLGTLVFALFWLGGVYGLVLGAFVPSGDELRRLLDDPIAFLLRSNLKWPLLITLLGGSIDAVQDHLHQIRHGGQFISTPGMQGAARWLTLFLGGIPFFMPVVLVVGLFVAVGKRLEKWMKSRGGLNGSLHSLVLTIMGPLMMIAFFATMAGLLGAGVSGWAIGYATAKFMAEILIVCLPWIAKTAHAEETAALDGTPPKKGRVP